MGACIPPRGLVPTGDVPETVHVCAGGAGGVSLGVACAPAAGGSALCKGETRVGGGRGGGCPLCPRPGCCPRRAPRGRAGRRGGAGRPLPPGPRGAPFATRPVAAAAAVAGRSAERSGAPPWRRRQEAGERGAEPWAGTGTGPPPPGTKPGWEGPRRHRRRSGPGRSCRRSGAAGPCRAVPVGGGIPGGPCRCPPSTQAEGGVKPAPLRTGPHRHRRPPRDPRRAVPGKLFPVPVDARHPGGAVRQPEPLGLGGWGLGEGSFCVGASRCRIPASLSRITGSLYTGSLLVPREARGLWGCLRPSSWLSAWSGFWGGCGGGGDIDPRRFPHAAPRGLVRTRGRLPRAPGGEKQGLV